MPKKAPNPRRIPVKKVKIANIGKKLRQFNKRVKRFK